MESLWTVLILLGTTNNILQYQQTPHNIRQLDYVDIVYRQERGAQNEWMFKDYPKYKKINESTSSKNLSITVQKEAELNKKRIQYILQTNPEEYEIQQKYNHIGTQELERPQEYYYPKNKIIIHHSAMSTKYVHTESDMQQHIQEIQELHSFTRGRGDVGYHFLIDKFGNIYEGRSGGPGVIGAHAQYNNFNSIGINLLGDFETEQPSPEQIESLIVLIIGLCKYYDISPYNQVLHHKKISNAPYIQNFTGNALSFHKEVGQTACPGRYMENKIPFVQEFVNQYLKQFQDRENQSQIVPQLLKKIPLTTNTSTIEKEITKEKLRITKTEDSSILPQNREKNEIYIEGRKTILILPKDEQQKNEITQLHHKILTSQAQNTQITTDERNYLIQEFNQYLIKRDTFLKNKTESNRELFFLQLQKLLQIAKKY